MTSGLLVGYSTNMKKQVVVISGPTGSGESFLTHHLIQQFPNRLCRLVTSTTRAPRVGEQHGVDYYFFSKEEFLQHDTEGNILEKAYITNRDTWYGTYAPDLQKKIDAGFIVIVNSQIVGTRYFKEHYNATTIFIDPESIQELMERIQRRSPELSEQEMFSRKENAEREVVEEGPYYDYHIRNEYGKIEETAARVVEILKKEGYTLE